MRVISKARLKQVWETPGYEDSEGAFRAWYSHVNSKTVTWQSWGDVKAEFGTASLVGNCAVFNIGGNKYRLVARVLHPSQKVFILKVMTRREYDEGKWKEECGCFTPSPKAKKKGTRKAPKRKRKGR